MHKCAAQLVFGSQVLSSPCQICPHPSYDIVSASGSEKQTKSSCKCHLYTGESDQQPTGEGPEQAVHGVHKPQGRGGCCLVQVWLPCA